MSSFFTSRRGRKPSLSPEERIAQAREALEAAQQEAAMAEAADNPLLKPILDLADTIRKRRNTGTAALSENYAQSFHNRRYKYQVAYLVTLAEERLALAIQESADSDLKILSEGMTEALEAIQGGIRAEAVADLVTDTIQNVSAESDILEAEEAVSALKGMQSRYRDLVSLPTKKRTSGDIAEKADLEAKIGSAFQEAYNN